MPTITEHIIRLTDHRDRDLLELTLSKALIDLLPIQRVVIARVVSEEGVKRWLEIATLDHKGGGKVVDPLRVDFHGLPLIDDNRERFNCLMSRDRVDFAWAGEDGPRINYLPLFADSRMEEEGVIEIHSAFALGDAQMGAIADVLHVFRNMYNLLAYSDRDALTGLLNRKSLDDTFYSAVLEELDEGAQAQSRAQDATVAPGQERRHRVPPNYWLGTVNVDNFGILSDKGGHLIAEEVLLLVARIMNNTFRTYDRIYRFGGEQFAVLMHCPDEALVLAAFERFRANMEKFNFPQVGRVTASAGFTRITADDSPSTALERTERAVDYAQHNGYNKVFSHGDLVRKGLFGDAPKIGAVDIF
ncbi:GGDEF domain-containing protein [Rhodoferax saidenbachensis]|uniref:diguanylate cyclase n=1 Tax=Rhodoferax saidenbachensis TaxID=1484693 RepID=A0A1P8KCG8_9BURK|nr:GGDEF domain-containing protein [Rhodoferax saidenbachensis]APW43655.1 GGDEF domain-containing protein [Rhodoferax saidenbachensis]